METGESESVKMSKGNKRFLKELPFYRLMTQDFPSGKIVQGKHMVSRKVLLIFNICADNAWPGELSMCMLHFEEAICKKSANKTLRQSGRPALYRVTIQLVANLPLTSEQKFRFGLDRPGQARPERNFCFEVNGRFATS